MSIKMILAINQANVIGWSNGDLPWHLPNDLKKFKKLTDGNSVVMGRKTFDSIKGKFPNGFPNRDNYVISSQKPFDLSGDNKIKTTNSLSELCAKFNKNKKDLWVCGGAQIYNDAIKNNLIDEIYLTIVNANTNADIALNFELASWKLFILQEAKKGNHWVMEDMVAYNAIDGYPSYCDIVLKKC